jgi:antitoxin (DNA-binding transcriptional repressor) of toxin-antitoxin stability system
MSGMKTLTMRELNRNTARVMNALESGETFELRRYGKTIGYVTPAPPPPERERDWKAHFEWLKKQPKTRGKNLVAEFEEDRRRLRAREAAMEHPE